MVKQIYKFYTDWCAPCKVYAPIVDEVCKELGIECVSINAQHHPEKAIEYGVTGVPCIAIAPEELITGLRTKTELTLELRRKGFGERIVHEVEPPLRG